LLTPLGTARRRGCSRTDAAWLHVNKSISTVLSVANAEES
jgi:hypothetical protein